MIHLSRLVTPFSRRSAPNGKKYGRVGFFENKSKTIGRSTNIYFFCKYVNFETLASFFQNLWLAGLLGPAHAAYINSRVALNLNYIFAEEFFSNSTDGLRFIFEKPHSNVFFSFKAMKGVDTAFFSVKR